MPEDVKPPVEARPGAVTLGRDDVLAEIAHYLDAAAEGRGAGMLVTGESGIGKSQVAREAMTRAKSQGFTLTVARCSAVETPPLWPWRGLGAAETRTELGDAADRRWALAELADRCLKAEGPSLLVLEDAHWADQASLDLTRLLADAAPGHPVLLMITSRDDPASLTPAIRPVLDSLPAHVRRIELTGLAEVAVAQLVAREGSDADPATLRRQTGGNPFFVLEVLRWHKVRHRGGALPPPVRNVVMQRVAHLPQTSHHVLSVAAVLGSPEPLSLLSAATGMPPDLIEESLEAAEGARLAQREGSGWAFSHDLVDEALIGSLGVQQRRNLQRDVVEALERAVEAKPELVTVYAGQLARLHREAGEPDGQERRVHWALTAARHAHANWGYEEAAALYADLLTHGGGDQTTVLLELAEAEFRCGRQDAAREHCLEAAERARAQGRPRELALAALAFGAGVLGFEVPAYDDVQAGLVDEAIASLGESERALLAALHARRSLALWQLQPGSSGAALDAQRVRDASLALTLAEQAGDVDVLLAALAADCDAHAGPDHVEHRLDVSARMLRQAQAAGRIPGQLLALRLRLVALLESGRFREADATIANYERLATRVRSAFFAWYVPLWRGMQALLAGDVDAALARAAEVGEVGSRTGSANAAILGDSLRFDALLLSGRVAETQSLIEHLRRELTASPQVRVGFSLAFLLVGDDGPARATVAGTRDPERGDVHRLSRDSEWLCCMWTVGDCALLLGDRAAAEWAYSQLEPYADHWAVDGIGAGVMGVVHHQLGRLAGVLGRTEEARDRLRHAERLYVDADARLLLATVRELIDEPDPVAAPETPHAELVRDGDLWTFHWRGATGTVRDTRGTSDLATLLGRPGVPVPAVELIAARGSTVVETDLGEVLDAKARDELRRRYLELEAEIGKAESEGSPTRLDSLVDERLAIAAALGEAYGLSGRARLAHDPAERARKAVARRIGTAIDAVERVHPALARHLRLTVRTGRVCRYEPEQPVEWTVRA